MPKPNERKPEAHRRADAERSHLAIVDNKHPWIEEAKWLSMIRAARYLGVHTMTVRRYAELGSYAHLNFPKPSIINDRRYWNRDEIDAWMRSRVTAVSSRRSA